MHEQTNHTGKPQNYGSNDHAKRHGPKPTQLTRGALGLAISTGTLTGPYSEPGDGGMIVGLWHHPNHGGPLDCTGCAMEHLRQILPE